MADDHPYPEHSERGQDSFFIGGDGVSMADAAIDVSAGVNFFFDQIAELDQDVDQNAAAIRVKGGFYRAGDHLLINREVFRIVAAKIVEPDVWELTVRRAYYHGGGAQPHAKGATVRRLGSVFAANVYGQHSLQARIAALEAELRQKLGVGLTIVEVPVVFGRWGNQPNYYGAHTANMVNSVFAGARLYATDPGNEEFRKHLRDGLQKHQIQAVFPAGATAWDNYHRWGGELHCGSNAKRTLKNPAWWTEEAFKDWGNR